MDFFFFNHFLRDPKKVGAITPLSRAVAKELLKDIIQGKNHPPWKILEVGAGTGSITREIVKLMQKDDQLDVIEIDRACCEMLEHKFKNDDRIKIQCLSILYWSPSYPYDCIVSTLPLNSPP